MLQSFRTWLISKKYTESTVKNYVTDINRYLDFVGPSSNVAHIFLDSVLSNYLSQISFDINYPRYLASLNQFCQFGISQNIISQNPLKKVRHQIEATPQTDLKHLLTEFSQYLIKHKSSDSTIKNYINDVNLYINWLNSES
ncbi:hypothetical protein KBC75_01635 [Candidatus Shapirobacteria bacterium]|nr:hypothetical protein [Candidatus Shapirobacteria bacterium]